MITFKQFLKEARANEIVHTNPSVNQIKALAKNAKFEDLRFVLTRHGDLHVGDSVNYTHNDLTHEPPEQWHSCGYIAHKNGSFNYVSMHPSTKRLPPDHKIYQQWRERGFKGI